MSLQLYYFPGACSMAIHVLLNELGLDVELIKGRDDAKNKTPELLKVNPRGQVPVLVDNGKVLREDGAIMVYLCDEFDSGLLPSDGWERAEALQWLMTANASLHPAYSRTNWLKKNGGTDEQIAASRAGAQEIWDQIEAQLNKSGPYICGENGTAADILITVIGNWADPGVYTYGPKTKELFKKIIARPAYQKALAAENIEYKAAA